MSLRINRERVQESQSQTPAVFTQEEKNEAKLVSKICTLAEFIIDSNHDASIAQFVVETIKDVPDLNGRIEVLNERLSKREQKAEEVVSRKRRFEAERDQFPEQKRAKMSPAEESMVSSSLPSGDCSALSKPNVTLDLFIADIAQLEEIDVDLFIKLTGIQSKDASHERVQKCFDYLNERRVHLGLSPVSLGQNSFSIYEKGFKEMEDCNLLTFWHELCLYDDSYEFFQGRDYLKEHVEIEKLSGSHLKSAFKDFLNEHCANLTTLGMEGKKGGRNLVMLPKEVLILSQLESIQISDYQLFALPKEIGNLTQLSELKLYGNRLSVLPKEIGKLANLRRIDLSFNTLFALPQEMENLTQLEFLDCTDNDLTEMPTWVDDFENLKSINLFNNHFKVPSEWHHKAIGCLDGF